MLAQDAELDWRPPARRGRRRRRRSRAGSSDSSAVGFVGREDECRSLSEAWAETLEGPPPASCCWPASPASARRAWPGGLARRAHARRRDRAARPLRRGAPGALPPVGRRAAPLRRGRCRRRCCERHVAAHGGELSRLVPELARRSARARRARPDRRRDRALPAVRRRRRPARGGRPRPRRCARARRPALGRQADAAAAAPPRHRGRRDAACCSSAPTATPTSRPSTRSPTCSPTCAASRASSASR